MQVGTLVEDLLQGLRFGLGPWSWLLEEVGKGFLNFHLVLLELVGFQTCELYQFGPPRVNQLTLSPGCTENSNRKVVVVRAQDLDVLQAKERKELHVLLHQSKSFACVCLVEYFIAFRILHLVVSKQNSVRKEGLQEGLQSELLDFEVQV